MKIATLVTFTLAGLCACASALNLSKDSDIQEAAAAMKSAGYEETRLQRVAANEGESLRFWSVEDGVVIARYSVKTSKILGLSYFLCDDRARGERTEFDLEVIGFDTDSGRMTIQTKKPKPGGKAD